MWSLVHLLTQYLSLFLLVLHFHAISSYGLFSNSSFSATKLCHDDESIALIHFKNSLSIDTYASDSVDAYPKTGSWEKGTDCCWWKGVMCDMKTGYVIGLNLSHSMLSGTFPFNSSLFFLSHLQYLDLSDNDFNSSLISSHFGNFLNLKYLDLSASKFVGQVPSEISLLSKLVSLHVSGNDLSIKTSVLNKLFKNLTMLRELDLRSVDMSSVAASSFMNLSSSLLSLKLGHCHLQGKSLEYVAPLRRLISLDLSFNYFDRPIETIVFNKVVANLTMLRELDLSFVNMSLVSPTSFLNLSSSLSSLTLKECELRGKFPGALLQRSNFQLLDLVGNEDIIGFLPPTSNCSASFRYLYLSHTKFTIDSVSNLNSLEELDLSGNFIGSDLALLGNLTQLNKLQLCPNDLHGTPIPYSFGNLVKLTFLDLFDCNISGQIPPSLGNLKQLSDIELTYNNLNGQIPASLGNLKQLTTLNIKGNNLNGRIPSSLGNLQQLSRLDLTYNNINGQIPSSLGNLKQLSYLLLGHNNLNGQIPFSLGNLKQLSYLDLSHNNLNGHVPSSLENLKVLIGLSIDNNNLSGSIPNCFANLTQLYELDLSNNQFIGPIPSYLGMFSNLSSLDLSNNQLNETIPLSLSTQLKLEYLMLQNNLLTGQIPEFQYNSLLSSIDLSNNKLHGPIPNSISKLVNVEILMLSSNNKLRGEIPSSICKLQSLQILDLSNNSLISPIPKCFKALITYANLRYLHLGMNSFNGTIPPIFPDFCSLTYINFYNNEFQGKIPRSIINCRNLEFLDLGHNKIIDTFPSFLGALSGLRVLVLRSNKLHGLVNNFSPNNSFPSLQIFYLSNNNLSGALPFEYFDHLEAMKMTDSDPSVSYMEEQPDRPVYTRPYSVELIIKGTEIELEKIQEALAAIDFSQNRFTGKIPKSIGKLKSLIYLNLSHNSLDDHIPISLGNLTNLEALDLSSNSLVGRIPLQLLDLTFLQVFNVSYNQLEGLIPSGKQFNTFDNSSYEGNLGLCGFPLSKDCNGSQTQNPNPSEEENAESNENGFGWKPVVIGYGCGVIFGVGIGFIVFKTRKRSWFVRMIEAEGYLWRTKFDKFRKASKAQRGRRN